MQRVLNSAYAIPVTGEVSRYFTKDGRGPVVLSLLISKIRKGARRRRNSRPYSTRCGVKKLSNVYLKHEGTVELSHQKDFITLAKH